MSATKEAIANPPKYFIATWGCQMNEHDSEKLAGALVQDGYSQANSVEDADVILLNTCSIREKAAEKVFGELGRLKPLKAQNPNLLIGVCGCVAQQEGEAIYKRAPYVDFVIGPRATASLPEILRKFNKDANPEVKPPKHQTDTEYRLDSIKFPFEAIRRQGRANKAFVTVVEGCNHRCTYCIVPTTRGREICRPADEILAEVKMLADQGILEVEFLGQTVNAYRDANGATLSTLLTTCSQVPGIKRLRFTTSHPAQMTDDLMDAMAAASPIVSPYLHLPVQSGSSRVLKAMKRGYTREKYLEKIEALRSRIPDLAMGTDIIVGFPGETEEEFEETLSLMKLVQYETCYSFTYSPRPGTASLQLGDTVPLEEKLRRLQTLQAMQREIQEVRHARYVGGIEEVLVEGPDPREENTWRGRSSAQRLVKFTGDATPGKIQPVLIKSSSAFSLRGEAALA